ncbi:hypothetical protein DID88_006951 [Monilinia fructigena]|uniref:Uncharacterized protein n=1 Tax=Monilinia fructigena TaxID=38457 RepID=A0A395IGC1_9HELO|nr:hypothetical protein DID88_006951 [Monilinia fructigena]
MDLAVDSQAIAFTKSSARYLFNKNPDMEKKLRSLYQQAADLSYHLWTRRTTLKISTRGDLNPLFDVEDPKMTLHSTVKEDTENKLTGQPIALFVHPMHMIELYGTEEGEDYENSLIFAPAEVWLYHPLRQEGP